MICTDCGRDKPNHGRGRCSACYSAWWRKENPEAAAVLHEKRMQRQREKRRARGAKTQRPKIAKTCTHESGCQGRTYARDLCETHYRRWWRSENREKKREYDRKWRQNHPEQIRELRRRHKKKTPARPKVSLKKKQVTTRESTADYMRRIRREFGIAC